MIKFKKGVAVLVCMLMTMCVLVACGSGSSSEGVKDSNALKAVDKADCLEIETTVGRSMGTITMSEHLMAK